MSKRMITEEEFKDLAALTMGGRMRYLRQLMQQSNFEAYQLQNVAQYMQSATGGKGSIGHLSQIERDKALNPNIDVLATYAEIMNCSMDVFFDRYYKTGTQFEIGFGVGELNPIAPSYDGFLIQSYPSRCLTKEEWTMLADKFDEEEGMMPVTMYFSTNLTVHGVLNNRRLRSLNVNIGEVQTYLRQEAFNGVLKSENTVTLPQGIVLKVLAPVVQAKELVTN